MASNDSQAVMHGVSTGVGQGLSIVKEITAGTLNILANLIGQNRDSKQQPEETIPGMLEKDGDLEDALRNLPCVTVPYVNRIAFEKEMTKAGMRFVRNSDIDLGEIEQQMYIIDSKDRIQAFDLVKKYSYLQPRHIITNEEQEKEYFQGCPITDVMGFDKISADRALRLLDEKGVLVSVSFDHNSGDYTLRVPREKEKDFLETIKEIEVFKDEPDSRWIQANSAYKSKMNDYIQSAGDFEPEDPCVIFDSEKPNHMLIVSKEGFEERYVTYNENNELEEQFVYRNSLNNAITKKRYEELANSNNPEDIKKVADFRPSYEKLTEDRHEFDSKLAAIADRMGTATVLNKEEFDKLTEEQKLAPGIVTQQALESELILAQEGDRLKAYTITKNERGSMTIEFNTSVAHGEVDVNKDRFDRAVKSTESEKILDNEEIGLNQHDQQMQTPQEKNKRIETDLIIKSSGFAAGVQKRDGQTQTIEIDSKDRSKDYRDIDNSGSIQDELLEAEKGALSGHGHNLSDERNFGGQDDFDHDEQRFFDED